MYSVYSDAVAKAIDTEADARTDAITSAIHSLSVSEKGGDERYIKSIKQVDGKIFVEIDFVDTDIDRVSVGGVPLLSHQAIINALNTGKTWNLNAQTANAFKSAYSSYLTPAQASAMVEGNRVWSLAYSKNYLQTVNVTWDDYQYHNFPAGATGMFFPGYGSNGGTLVLVNYPSSRMLYNVWIDSNRWSGWHYVDLTAITYN